MYVNYQMLKATIYEDIMCKKKILLKRHCKNCRKLWQKEKLNIEDNKL